ncbi:unnamed protein product [Microthlaspi erraticum]|uniref:Uncharacterized protein n=1 Tax=Microthlaspi erraticum TaxID=1685480 RepID=A0A6D2JAS1_9BRAS|nr:unnamed protein product [Microthlaspi erraticum]
MFSRVSKWFDSIHNFFSRTVTQVQDSLSCAIAKLQSFFARIIAKFRSFVAAVISWMCGFFAAAVAKLTNFFVAVISKIRGFFAAIIAKIHNFFVTISDNVRSFFSTVKTLFRLIQKLQMLLRLISEVLDTWDRQVALHRKFLQVFKILNRFVDLGTIFGGMVHQH